MKYIVASFRWLFSLHPRDNVLPSEADKFLLSMKATAKTRYNASIRLKYLGKFTFLTTTFLSLGLIFIPLIQNSGVKLALSSGVINSMQLFIAVSVLVYSVIQGTARYELRSEQFNECGDNLKELIREFGREREAANGQLSTDQLARFEQRYSDITTEVENHTRGDYRLVTLAMKRDYRITGIPRVSEWLLARTEQLIPYTFAIALVTLEVLFITDILGVTKVFANVLTGADAPNAG
jgi:conflict system pore-forming effector with SLATT domain